MMDQSQSQIQRRKCSIRSSLYILSISYCSLSAESFCPPSDTFNPNRRTTTTTPHENQHHHSSHNLRYRQQQKKTFLPYSVLPPLYVKSSSLPESSSSRNERNNKGKPVKAQPLDTRTTGLRKDTALKATGMTKIAKRPATRTGISRSTMGTVTKAKNRTTTMKSKQSKIQYDENSGDEEISHSIRAKRLAGKTVAGAWYQRDEMMQHDILTREDEIVLGSKVVRAKKLRDQMISLIEKRRLETIELEQEMNLNLNWETADNSYDLDGIGMGMDFNDVDEDDDDVDADSFGFDNGIELSRRESNAYSDTRYDTIHSIKKMDHRTSSTLVQDGSKLIVSSFDADLNILTQEDVMNVLEIEGGKSELRAILHEGARARNKLMRSNIRLVVSIGKKWMGRSSDHGKISDRYNGSWDRPSLDEIIQEGMLGLARAVDKYDPDRGLRFSTYSTHWITSYVRQCFQASATGCLKVPSQLHDIKVSHRFFYTV